MATDQPDPINRHYMVTQCATALREKKAGVELTPRLAELGAHWQKFPFWEQCLIRAMAKAQIEGEVSR